jgi:hypothetical protein
MQVRSDIRERASAPFDSMCLPLAVWFECGSDVLQRLVDERRQSLLELRTMRVINDLLVSAAS